MLNSLQTARLLLVVCSFLVHLMPTPQILSHPLTFHLSPFSRSHCLSEGTVGMKHLQQVCRAITMWNNRSHTKTNQNLLVLLSDFQRGRADTTVTFQPEKCRLKAKGSQIQINKYSWWNFRKSDLRIIPKWQVGESTSSDLFLSLSGLTESSVT